VNGEDAEFAIDLSGLPVAAQRAVNRAIGTGDLNIPDKVFERAFAAAKADDVVAMGASMGAGVFRVLPDIVQVAIRSAAPTIVAAELDRLIEAESVNVNESGYHWRGIDVEDLRRRASELRGEG